MSADVLMYKVELTTLDIGNNFISLIENLSHLKLLEELWVRRSFFAIFLCGSNYIGFIDERK